jgi:hypothetical protein
MTSQNPFTHYLRTRLAKAKAGDRDPARTAAVIAAERFATFWDDVETLVIQVYRAKAARPVELRDWDDLRACFDESYAPVATALAAHWPGTRAAGKPVTADPYRAIASRPTAAAFVGDWLAMQLLPAAREALNRHLIDLGAEADTDATRP